jgi:uncharacterized membrane protein YfcA
MLLMILGALIVGATLGLTGTGGSIITVPVLTYVLGHDAKVAIPESLAIVGSIALLAMLPYARARQIDWRSVAFFGLPGMSATYCGAWLSRYVSAAVQLAIFAIVMLTAAASMLRRSRGEVERGPDDFPGMSRQARCRIVIQGMAVGLLTGLVGVGGGILIVPALVVLGNLPLRIAIGTSLVLVSLNAFSGFLKYVQWLQQRDRPIDWSTILAFVLIGGVGSVAGSFFGSKVNQAKLRRAFAFFLFAMGLVILGKELPHVWQQWSASVI